MKTFIAVILALNTGLFWESLDSRDFAEIKLNFPNLFLQENYICSYFLPLRRLTARKLIVKIFATCGAVCFEKRVAR